MLSDLTLTRNNFSNPAVTPQQLDTDWYACAKQNMSDPQSSRSDDEAQMAKQCMAARGYSYVESPLYR